MRKPNFICIGAQKAGTTSLQDLLSTHPSIYLSPIKEIKYFHRDEHYSKGMEWYLNHFKEALPHQIIGDITPDYILYGNTAKRIAKDLGRDIKIIVLLRHPVNRTFSQFNFHRAAKVESNSNFKSIIDNYPPIDYENINFKNWHTPSYYIERSLYFNQLNRYYELFPKENIHVAIFEELYGPNHNEELQKILHFLDLEQKEVSEIVHSHSTRVPKENSTYKVVQNLKNIKTIIKPLLPNKVYNSIREKILNSITKKPEKLDLEYKNQLFETFFKNDVSKVEQLIGRKIDVWKK